MPGLPWFTRLWLSVLRDVDRPAQAHRARRATVIGRWGDDTVLLRLEDGTTIEAPVPEGLGERWDVGARVEAAFVGPRLIGWQLASLLGLQLMQLAG
jgi:hypothetical protein